MIHPSDPQPAWPRGKVDASRGPVTCAACGCRLEAVGPAGASAWKHFNPIAGRDARGCRIDCADLPHDAAGRALLSLTA